MAKIDTFRQKFEGLIKESDLVDTLSKSSGEDFVNNWSDFIGYLQSEHKNIVPAAVSELPAANPADQLLFAKQYAENTRVNALKYGMKNIEEIVSALDDKIPILINTLPIRDADIQNKKSYDLDRLTQDYEDIAKRLKDNLIPLPSNPSDAQKERHSTQERAIKKYEEFASLLKDKKELVKNILGYRELVSYLGGEDRQPNTERMKELYTAHLNKILDGFGDDKAKYADNIGVIGTLKYLAAKNSDFLTGQYVERILEPAKEKLQAVVESSDAGKYVSRTVGVKNPREQMQFFERVYTVAEAKLAKNRRENKLLNKAYDLGLRE